MFVQKERGLEEEASQRVFQAVMSQFPVCARRTHFILLAFCANNMLLVSKLAISMLKLQVSLVNQPNCMLLATFHR
jgi:hypothetical protein